MYGLNEIAEYVRARYEESLAEKFAGQKFDNIDSRFKSTATKMLADGLAKEIIGEQPSIDPRKVAAIFKRYNPKIEKRTESGKKRSERIKIHNDAAKAYTLGLANSLGYIEDVKDELKLSTLDRQILSKMDKNARITICENYPQTLESYYKDWNPAANEEKAARIGQATKSLNKVYFDAIKKLIEDRAKVFKKTLDDKSLIKEYGSIAADCELIRNAAELLDKISANKPEGVTEDQINECKNSINKLLPNAVKYQERMAIMADPYYPYINLETL